MRPELDDTLAAPVVDPMRTATAPRARPAGESAPGLVPGQQLGHFRIEKQLGAGGMGEVYLGTDLALDRPVAIKVLPAALARDPARRERMVREARAQARITHPNVGHIYFIGEEAGRLYFAMEYVAGQTLAERLAGGPVTAEDALALIRSAALGLREAQRSGITHRDIKPSNLMIDGHGMIKVLDFGLAASAPAEDGEILDGPVAQTSLAGTPLYMAPEQARGEPVDFRADIYALGATLFHLVAGRPPFEADDLGTLLSKHAHDQRPAVPRRSGQPRTTIAAIDALCSRMMAPLPADRFASYDELIRAIELASVEQMRPAGLWVRSMATLADLMITGLATLVLEQPLRLLFDGADNGFLMFVVFALYATSLLARSGRTLGQSLFELEVIDVGTGEKPTWGRAGSRVAVAMAGPTAAMATPWLFRLLGIDVGILRSPLMFVLVTVPAVALVWASLRSLGKRTFWDRRSGTMVRYRTRRATAI